MLKTHSILSELKYILAKLKNMCENYDTLHLLSVWISLLPRINSAFRN
jgi:hypothetical protein